MFSQFGAGMISERLCWIRFHFVFLFKATPFNRMNEGLITKIMVFLRRLVYHKGMTALIIQQ